MELDPLPTGTAPRSLQRPCQGRLVGGVAAGLADYFDVDVVIVRIVLAVLALVGGIGVPLYVAAWVLVPEEGSDRSIADHLLSGMRPEGMPSPGTAPVGGQHHGA